MMFEVKDRIVYGTHGVCEVMAVGRLLMSVADHRRKYYTLRPLYQPDSVIYVPVDSRKVQMRPVLTEEEAERFLQEIPTIDTIWVVNEKEREFRYKEAMLSGDCRNLVRVIKTIYLRRLSREKEGKKIAAVDERYFRQARDLLYGELSCVLSLDREEVESHIRERIEGAGVRN